jgi:hypothetical protein
MSTNPASKGPFGNSEAQNSEIKSVDNDKSEAKQLLFELAGNLRMHQEEIDSMKTGMVQLLGKMQEIIDVQNSTSKMLGGGQAQTEPQGQKVQSMIMLKDILDSKLGEKLIERIFPENQVQQSIIDPQIMNDHLRKSLMGNFEVGEALIDTLKNKIVGKAMTKVVGDIIKHEPE